MCRASSVVLTDQTHLILRMNTRSGNITVGEYTANLRGSPFGLAAVSTVLDVEERCTQL